MSKHPYIRDGREYFLDSTKLPGFVRDAIIERRIEGRYLSTFLSALAEYRVIHRRLENTVLVAIRYYETSGLYGEHNEYDYAKVKII